MIPDARLQCLESEKKEVTMVREYSSGFLTHLAYSQVSGLFQKMRILLSCRLSSPFLCLLTPQTGNTVVNELY